MSASHLPLSLRCTFSLVILSFFLLVPISGQSLPAGSYQNSCKECSYVNSILTCMCLATVRHYEEYVGATIDISSCPHTPPNTYGDIVNAGGDLNCIPPGSYVNSCLTTDYYWSPPIFEAQCPDSSGHIAGRSLFDWGNAYGGCQDLQNQNASLVCIQNGLSPPKGTYQTECGNCSFANYVLQCQCGTVPVALNLLDCKPGWIDIAFQNNGLNCVTTITIPTTTAPTTATTVTTTVYTHTASGTVPALPSMIVDMLLVAAMLYPLL